MIGVYALVFVFFLAVILSWFDLVGFDTVIVTALLTIVILLLYIYESVRR